MEEELYYIQSQYGTVGNCISWWAIDAKGYTCDLKKAWKLPYSKAVSHCMKDRQDQIRKASEVERLAELHFDFQKLNQIEP